MFFFFSLIPATFVVIIGYFVLFSTTKTQGAVKRTGQILAIWLFVIAAFFALAGMYATVTGFSVSEQLSQMHEKMERQMHPDSAPGGVMQ